MTTTTTTTTDIGCECGRAGGDRLVDVAFDDATEVGSIQYRLAPIDVGFDLRVQGTAVVIGPGEELRVSYADRDGERRVMQGPRALVIRRLRRLGYRCRSVSP